MDVREESDDGVLRVRVSGRTLVRPPQWDLLPSLRGGRHALVVLEFDGAEFVSALFLLGCVELGRALAGQGRKLVLMNLSPHHRHLLELVEGGADLPVLESEAELAERRAELAGAPPQQQGEGVSNVEKRMLWS